MGTKKSRVPVLRIDGSSRVVIGAALRKKRHESGLKIYELAQRIGISGAQVTRLERGTQGFRAVTLCRFARALGVRIVLTLE